MGGQLLSGRYVRRMVIDDDTCSLRPDIERNPHTTAEVRVRHLPVNIQYRDRAVRGNPADEVNTPGIERKFSFRTGEICGEQYRCTLQRSAISRVVLRASG